MRLVQTDRSVELSNLGDVVQMNSFQSAPLPHVCAESEVMCV